MITSPTKQLRSLLQLVAAVAVCALLFTACGSDATEVATETEPASAPAPTPEPEPEPSAEDAMLGAFGPGCVAVPADGKGSFVGMADDPAGTAASNNPVLSTLVSAVVAADLVDTLNSDGPFTIFAPTNDAFAAIDEDTLAAVLADKDLLTSILTYHVIAGESLTAADLIDSRTQATVNGQEIAFVTNATGTVGLVTDGPAGNGAALGGATSICSNVPVANGTVHIIDTVLLP